MIEALPLKLKDLPESEKPREKLLAKGAWSLSDAELLAILLRTGSSKESVLRLAERLLHIYNDNGLRSIAHLSPQDLAKVRGIGPAKAMTVLAAIELGKRLAQQPTEKKQTISSPGDAAHFMMGRLRYEERENFVVMLLNTKNHVLATPTVSVGSLNASIVQPREIFREAIRHAAASMILVHNHPSGDPSPSKEDISVTRMLVDAGKLMDIAVLDHIIIGDNQYISMKEKQLIV